MSHGAGLAASHQTAQLQPDTSGPAAASTLRSTCRSSSISLSPRCPVPLYMHCSCPLAGWRSTGGEDNITREESRRPGTVLVPDLKPSLEVGGRWPRPRRAVVCEQRRDGHGCARKREGMGREGRGRGQIEGGRASGGGCWPLGADRWTCGIAAAGSWESGSSIV
jgi:hypothetical protein